MTGFTSTYVDASGKTKNCDIDYTLWFAGNATQVTIGNYAFEFPSPGTTTSIGQIYQGDNANVGTFPLTFKGAVKYGTNTATVTATLDIKGNPCISASVSSPVGVASTLVMVNGPTK